MGFPDFTGKQWMTLIVLWAAILSALGAFSVWPSVQVTPDDHTTLKLMVRYSGKRLGECRRLDASELAELPPNMRQANLCPRGKSPLFAELLIDGEVRYQTTIDPSGYHDDGVLAEYQRLSIPTGDTRITLRIRDHIEAEGFTHVLDRNVTVAGDRIVTVQFADDGFTLGGAS